MGARHKPVEHALSHRRRSRRPHGAHGLLRAGTLVCVCVCKRKQVYVCRCKCVLAWFRVRVIYSPRDFVPAYPHVRVRVSVCVYH